MDFKKGDRVIHPFLGTGEFDDGNGKISYVFFDNPKFRFKSVQTRCLQHHNDIEFEIALEKAKKVKYFKHFVSKGLTIKVGDLVLTRHGVCKLHSIGEAVSEVIKFTYQLNHPEKIKLLSNSSIRPPSKKHLNAFDKKILFLKKKKERLEEIKEMLSKGISCVQIGEKFGVNASRIQQISDMFDIRPVKIKREKYVKLIEEFKEAISNGVSYKQAKLDLKINRTVIGAFNKLGYKALSEYLVKRNDKMANTYEDGNTAKVITKDKYNDISSVGSVYNVVSGKMGVYKHPEIKRACKGLFESDEVIENIKKLRRKKLTYSEIAEKLNEMGLRTTTGLKFTSYHVGFKAVKIANKKAKIRKITT